MIRYYNYCWSGVRIQLSTCQHLALEEVVEEEKKTSNKNVSESTQSDGCIGIVQISISIIDVILNYVSLLSL